MIELKGVVNAYQAASPVKAARKAENGQAWAVRQEKQADSVDLSPDAALHVELSHMARTQAQKLSQPASAERIASLQERYRGDNCPVSGREIAAAIFRTVIGE